MIKNCSIHAHLPLGKLNQYIESFLKHHINIELYANADDLDNTPIDRFTEWANMFQDKGIEITIHAPYMDLSPGGIDSKIRRASLERMIQLMDIAKILNPHIIAVHPGYDHWRNSRTLNQWTSNSASFWREILDYTANSSFKLAIENIFEQTPESLQKLIENIGSPRFGFCFDTGHFNLFSKVPLEKWFETLGPYLIETHIHDNKGDKDSHLPIGEGTFPFSVFFDLLSDMPGNPILTFECHSEEGVLTSVNYYKNNFASKSKQTSSSPSSTVSIQ